MVHDKKGEMVTCASLSELKLWAMDKSINQSMGTPFFLNITRARAYSYIYEINAGYIGTCCVFFSQVMQRAS